MHNQALAPIGAFISAAILSNNPGPPQYERVGLAGGASGRHRCHAGEQRRRTCLGGLAELSF